jgi:excisionase family DNA binding protein
MNIPKKYLNVQELSEYLGLHISTIYRKVNMNEIPHSRIGGRLLFDIEKIDLWVEANQIVNII